MNPKRLLKIGEAAGLLGVTTQTLRNWTNNGYMNAIIRKGGHRRFRISNVKRMMEIKENDTTSKKRFFI